MKVAVLCGGRSHERAVSLRSGERVSETLRELGHEPVLVDVGPDTSRRLRDGGFDVAFIALHGRGGEDGTAQSLLELLGIPYTGTRAGECEATFDKARAKRLMIADHIPTPRFIALSESALEEFGAADALDEARDAIGYPMVVKPARGGSSLGVRFVEDDAALPRALIGAMSYDRHVVVEQHIDGRELAIALVQTSDGVRVLPPVEITPRNADWFDYESRYEHGGTEFTCPPSGLDEATLVRLEDVAVATWNTLGLRGVARVDVMLDETNHPWVLEAALVPGLTDTSLMPLALEAGGLSFSDLVAELLRDATA
jgi:D-alanine-D-alanine ligase